MVRATDSHAARPGLITGSEKLKGSRDLEERSLKPFFQLFWQIRDFLRAFLRGSEECQDYTSESPAYMQNS